MSATSRDRYTPTWNLRTVGVVTGSVGGLVTVLATAATIGVAHHRIGQNEVEISQSVPQIWAEEHVKHVHESGVEKDEVATIQRHLEYQISKVEKDVERLSGKMDDVGGKIDKVLLEVTKPR